MPRPFRTGERIERALRASARAGCSIVTRFFSSPSPSSFTLACVYTKSFARLPMLEMSSPFQLVCFMSQTVTSSGASPEVILTSQFSFVRTVTSYGANA